MNINQLAMVLSIITKLFGLWFIAAAVMCWKRPKSHVRREPETRFACMIPARNEQSVIAETVKSLLTQNYPRGLFDVYVIPNNCTDGTEAEALSAGAEIIRCSGAVRCKGDALRQAVKRLVPLGYTAFCVFDADNIVHPDFLARMNDAFLSGARVAKAAMAAKNAYETSVTGCYAMYYGLFDRIFNRSRANMGLSAKLVGTGFAVHRDVIESLGGWPTETIAEDAEFSAICARLGERVVWVPEALTYDEAPRTLSVSVTQRMRWSGGIMSAASKELGPLVKGLPGRGFWRRLDCVMFLIAPFIQAFSVIPVLLAAAGRLLSGGIASLPSLLIALAVSAGASLAAGAGLALISGLRDRRIIKSVLLFPVFMAVWLPIQVVSVVHRTSRWKEIRHSGSVDAQVKRAVERAVSL